MKELEPVASIGQTNRIAETEQWQLLQDTLKLQGPRPRPESEQPEPERRSSAVEKIIDSFDPARYRLSFKIDEQSGEVLVQILDVLTGEVIRQIPPEERMKLAQMIRERLGLLVDERR